MGSTRRKFTAEYKAEAVSLVLGSDRPVRQIAANIGVHEMTLGRWVKDAKDARDGSELPPLGIEERSELKALRAENTELRMQVEFAKSNCSGASAA